MCIAIPSRIIHIKNNMATIDVDGVRRQTSMLLLEEAQVGDYVIVHAGFAIQKLDEASALETLRLLRTAADPSMTKFKEPDNDENESG
jgi:hydrogenase expression/formation protein HypC